MADSIGYRFPTGISIGHIFQNLTDGGIYRYISENPLLTTNWILISGEMVNDPDISSWTIRQSGARWFNITQNQFKGWNGIQIVILG